MFDAFVADLAGGLVCKLVSLATEEVIQAWNLHQDLVTLSERLETIDALLSDADTKKLTMSSCLLSKIGSTNLKISLMLLILSQKNLHMKLLEKRRIIITRYNASSSLLKTACHIVSR